MLTLDVTFHMDWDECTNVGCTNVFNLFNVKWVLNVLMLELYELFGSWNGMNVNIGCWALDQEVMLEWYEC